MPVTDMTTAEELRLIADSMAMVMPFQAARLHVLAGRVDRCDQNSATLRAQTTSSATLVPRGAPGNE